MKINYQPDVFPDPEKCGIDSFRACKFIEYSNCMNSCVLFSQDDENPIYIHDLNKHDECKKYYQEAKQAKTSFENGPVSFHKEKPEFKKWNTKHINF